jgi:hypothetical protein
LTTIKLEIGANLKDSIAEVVNAVRAGGGIYHGDIGKSVQQAFGIDFSKAILGETLFDGKKLILRKPNGSKWVLEVE